jgi:histidine triad (HIT) family protein
MNCIFCGIIKKEIPSEIVYEDEKIIAFKDINPLAPVHILIIPKKHIESVNDLKEEDKDLVGYLFLIAQKVADLYEIKDKGYKLSFNVGKGAGQEVEHLHMHLIGGWIKK